VSSGEGNASRSWRIETLSIALMRRMGWGPDTMRACDNVTVTINPSRTADRATGWLIDLDVEGREVPSLTHGERVGAIKQLVERFALAADGQSLLYSFKVTDPVHLVAPLTGEMRWLYRPDVDFQLVPCDPEAMRSFLDNSPQVSAGAARADRPANARFRGNSSPVTRAGWSSQSPSRP
jgi:hypothetical protein